MFVFDKYAIVVRNNNLIDIVYYDQFRGREVPVNFEVELYNDMQFRNEFFEKVTFWDYTGRGNYIMLAAIKSSGAITIYSFESAINPDSRISVMVRDDSKRSFLLASTQITAFETSKDFLIVGCATCDNNAGWLKLYSPEKIRLFKGIPGSRGQN